MTDHDQPVRPPEPTRYRPGQPGPRGARPVPEVPPGPAISETKYLQHETKYLQHDAPLKRTLVTAALAPKADIERTLPDWCC
jgi:hypothetical protein